MAASNHGKPGRPPVGRPTGRKVTLYMLPVDEARAKQLGGGNLSLGVRVALQRATDSAKVNGSKK